MIIDGKNAILGRLAAKIAKASLKGEEVKVINCEQIIITGDKAFIKNKLEEKRQRVGSTQKGPKVSRTSEKIVKRAIRGMLPNYRTGRGREALKRIKCYSGVPVEFEKSNVEKFTNKETRGKKVFVKEISK
jgi:large subunit ribosomal protein L13